MVSLTTSISAKRKTEGVAKSLFLVASLFVILAVVSICGFIFKEGASFFRTESLGGFLFSTVWKPTADVPSYGIFSFIIASIEVTFLSLLFALPLGLFVSIALEEVVSARLKSIIGGFIEVLQGIPSVIFGLVGMSLVVPFVKNRFGGNGYSILTSSIVLAIMILPTLTNVISTSLEGVNPALKEGSYALGATKAETVLHVVLKDSRLGIITAVILALGRSVGETTAVLMLLGNASLFPHSLLSMSRTLTMNIVTDMSYAEGVHMNALFATSLLLLIIILLLNSLTIYISHKVRKSNG